MATSIQLAANFTNRFHHGLHLVPER
jgi:hypothetical protein